MWSGRNRANRFAAILDGGEPAPAADEELSALIALTSALVSLPLQPPPVPAARREIARATLLQDSHRLLGDAPAVAAPSRSARGSRVRPRFGGLATAGAGSLAFLVAGGGVALAAQRALPGDLLYPVKQEVEQVQLLLHPGATSAARERLAFAAARLQELRGLVAAHAPAAPMQEALADWRREVQAARGPLLAAGAGPQRQLLAAVVRQRRELASLAPTLPGGAQTMARDAIGYLTGTVNLVDSLLKLVPSAGLETGAHGTGGSGTGTGRSVSPAPSTRMPSPSATTAVPPGGAAGARSTPTVPAPSTVTSAVPVPAPSTVTSAVPLPVPSSVTTSLPLGF